MTEKGPYIHVAERCSCGRRVVTEPKPLCNSCGTNACPPGCPGSTGINYYAWYRDEDISAPMAISCCQVCGALVGAYRTDEHVKWHQARGEQP